MKKNLLLASLAIVLTGCAALPYTMLGFAEGYTGVQPDPAPVAQASGSIMCGVPSPAPPNCTYVCMCANYPYGCHFKLMCP